MMDFDLVGRLLIRFLVLVIIIAVSVGCLIALIFSLLSGCNKEPVVIKAPLLEENLRQYMDENKEPVKRNFTTEQLEEMASHEEREGFGMNFYYDELRRRSDAKWAREKLERANK